MAAGIDNVVCVTDEIAQSVAASSDAQMFCMDGGDVIWNNGEMEFEAEIRALDHAVSCDKGLAVGVTHPPLVIVMNLNFW